MDRQEVLKQILPSAIAAAVVAALQITFVLAFATVLLGQSLSTYLVQGVGILLTGTVISIVIIALLSSYPGSFGSAQDIPVSLMSVMIVSITASYAQQGGSTDQTFYTVIGAFMITTLCTAVLLLLMSFFKLGKVIRFVPFPVIGGVLASTGWVLTMVGFGMLVDQAVDYRNIISLFAPEMMFKWLPGFAVAILLLFTSRLIKSPFTLPTIVLLAFAGVHLVLMAMDISIDAAQSRGILLKVNSEALSFGINPMTIIAEANWALLSSYWPMIISICGLSVLMVMIQVSSLEVIVDQDMKMNQELFANGIANLGIGGMGGLVSYHHISDTSIAHRLGARTRLVGLLGAALCALPFLVGTQWLGYFPIPVLAGIILYLGFDFLYDWLIRPLRHLPLWEYLIVVAIFLSVMLLNFPIGVGIGVLCSILLFIVRSSQVSVVNSIVSGAACKSVVVRSEEEQHYLAERENAIGLLRLKGFLFFGSTRQLFAQVREYVSAHKRGQGTLIFDFKEVSNIDYSAVMGLVRIQRYLEKENIKLWLSNIPSASRKLVYKALRLEARSNIIYETADRALEAAEEGLLINAKTKRGDTSGLVDLLSQAGLSPKQLKIVLAHLQRHDFKDGEYITRAGDIENSFYIVDQGQLAIHQLREGEKIRLRVLKPSMVVGEMAVYSGQPRTADVIAQGHATVYEFTSEQLSLLEKNHSKISLKIHRMLGNRITTMLSDETHLQRVRD